MARPKSIDDEQILEAARNVFFEEGIQATTATIADRAGISEGTIYRRFETKHDLFVAAMDLPYPPPWIERFEALDGDNNLEEELYDISLEIIDFFEEILPKLNMVMCNLSEDTLLKQDDSEAPPLCALKSTIRFFERQRRNPGMRAYDPEVVARMYLGSLFHFAFAELSGINTILPMPRETYTRGIVQNLLNGLRKPDTTGEAGSD